MDDEDNTLESSDDEFMEANHDCVRVECEENISNDQVEDAIIDNNAETEDISMSEGSSSATCKEDSESEFQEGEGDESTIDQQDNEKESELEILKQHNFMYEGSRTQIPAEKVSTSLGQFFSLIRSAIGKELWRVTMPVHFNEPLSLMQRICEDLEYSTILNQAGECADSLTRLAYVTAFAISPFSTTIGRHSKPFNPILGETYELVDDNLDYCCFCEQVSHHPPVLAIYCEGRTWEFWQEYKFESKFRGQFLRVSPTGDVHVRFKDNKNHYSWNRPDTTVHNLLIGSIWVDQDGQLDVVNHQTHESSYVRFESWHKVGRTYKNIKGEVKNSAGLQQFELNGIWDSYLDCIDVTDGTIVRVWEVYERPKLSPKMYGFTQFSMKLNQMQEGMCPTDSRLRPDQRLMEEGKVHEAAREKHRLEEKQRAARRYRHEMNIQYRPRWFTIKKDPDTKTSYHMYTGRYWKARLQGKFGDVPNLFY